VKEDRGVEEVELRPVVGLVEAGLEEAADRADVLPIALEDVGVDTALLDGPGTACLPKSVWLLLSRSKSTGGRLKT
jgi:hypothetical protein